MSAHPIMTPNTSPAAIFQSQVLRCGSAPVLFAAATMSAAATALSTAAKPLSAAATALSAAATALSAAATVLSVSGLGGPFLECFRSLYFCLYFGSLGTCSQHIHNSEACLMLLHPYAAKPVLPGLTDAHLSGLANLILWCVICSRSN